MKKGMVITVNLNICNNCGGEYMYRNGRWICSACGSYKPETISNEEVTLLYTAFQKLRLAEFDEAELEFDDIIRKYPENPNAYWGRLMAKYGIKYEQDFDGRMIPTCYAASIESVLSSSDYRKALQYADAESRDYYQQQAEYIERVRREWVEKASKEKPYDIFICYKESDLASGIERTGDSVAVQDLYIHLTNKGYRVFYSHESLRDKVGEKYEPYIFNALSTAKVMLVYGSKPEYITSTWLKNEWTRYEERLKNGEKKKGSLLVACDGFSPNELPRVLASMQCFNANDRSFYSDLDETIEKLLRKEEKAPAGIPSAPSVPANKPIPPKNKKPNLLPIALVAAVLIVALIWFISSSNKCDHAVMTKPAVEPTCTEYGWTEEQYCAICGEIFQPAEQIPMREHKASGGATCTEDSRCILCDDILEPARGHRPGAEATCTDAQSCSECGAELNGALGHAPGGEATCTEAQYCLTCHAELEPAKGHSHWADVTEPTCQERGYTTYTCECGDTYVEDYVDALGHVKESDATCTEDSFCERCGELLESKNGHVPGAEATCTSPQYCIVCNALLDEMKKHEYETTVIPSTCTEWGYTVFTCRCGDTYNENYTDPLGHSPSGKDVCTEESVCTRCTEVLEPATQHTVNEWIVDRELTETVDGIRHGFCEVCRERIEKQYSYSQDLFYEELADGTYAVHIYQCKDSLIIIPSAHEGKIVSAIAVNGFGYQNQLKKVIIPDTVSTIGEMAFSNCENLESVTIGNSVTTIGSTAFYACKKLVSLDLSTTSVAVIGESAFAYCTKLASVTLSTGLQKIEAYAFEGCKALRSVEFPSTLTKIGIEAFMDCDGIKTVVLPNGLTELCERAFAECEILTSVTIGNLLTEIPLSAFELCPSLVSVTLGSGITTIGDRAFYQCGRLADCTIPESVTSIGDEAFFDCVKLKSVSISDQVTYMGDSAFYNCDSLKTLVIGEGLTMIPGNAFGDCDQLLTVVIGNSVDYIGVGAFNGCEALVSVTVGSGMIQIGSDAFYQCNRLTEVVNLSTLRMQAGSTDHGYLVYHAKDVHGGESKVRSENEYLFYFYGDIWYLIGYIGDETDIVLPDSCFGNSYEIYLRSFMYDREITSLVIPDTVTVIGENAFWDCDCLTSVTIGSGVTAIESYAFYACTYLSEVIFNGTVEQWNAIEIGVYVFDDTPVTKIICSDGEVLLAE